MSMRRMLIALCLAATGCATTGMGLETAYGNAGLSAALHGEEVSPNYPALLFYGGEDHRVFLGCFNCAATDASSIRNRYGEFGNPYSSTSLFNRYDEYRNPYSDTSACNRYALHPPVIVDQGGQFYGALTINRYANPTRIVEVAAWLNGLCSN